jgi:hypothetical protein
MEEKMVKVRCSDGEEREYTEAQIADMRAAVLLDRLRSVKAELEAALIEANRLVTLRQSVQKIVSELGSFLAAIQVREDRE